MCQEKQFGDVKYEFPQNVVEGKKRKGRGKGTNFSLTEWGTVKDNDKWWGGRCEGRNEKGDKNN